MPDPLRDLTDIRRFSNAWRLVTEKRVEALTDRLIAGEITLSEWQLQMKDELRHANHMQFVIGKGGMKEGIAPTEYLKLGTELSRQYRYLQRFADEIAERDDQGLGIEFARARAKLYAKSTQAVMWRSAVPVDLPQVPRDGRTACGTNCKCRLDFDYQRGEQGEVTAVEVYWKMRPAEHCMDCVELAREWSPLVIPTEGMQQAGLARGGGMAQAVALLLTDLQLSSEDEGTLREMWGLDVKGGKTCKVTSAA